METTNLRGKRTEWLYRVWLVYYNNITPTRLLQTIAIESISNAHSVPAVPERNRPDLDEIQTCIGKNNIII